MVPAGVPHYMWAKDGEVVIKESGTNPTATDLVPPPPAAVIPHSLGARRWLRRCGILERRRCRAAADVADSDINGHPN